MNLTIINALQDGSTKDLSCEDLEEDLTRLIAEYTKHLPSEDTLTTTIEFLDGLIDEKEEWSEIYREIYESDEDDESESGEDDL